MANKTPKFERVEYGGIFPEAIALPMNAEKLMKNDAASDFGALIDLKESPTTAWCHELRLRMWVRNSSTRLLDIVGIAPNKRIVESSYGTAIMFPPQGGVGGDVVRFECNLDKDAPSMRRFDLCGYKKRYASSEYYFDEGVLEVEPHHVVCISILFYATDRVYGISPEIIVNINGQPESIPVPADRVGIVCPAGMIPDTGKMVRTFDGKPPFFMNAPELFDEYLRQ
ncbi:MAG: hypothetical protein ACOX12_06215 [Eggerthellaceae bacterium]|jgi:hypothetical protein